MTLGEIFKPNANILAAKDENIIYIFHKYYFNIQA